MMEDREHYTSLQEFTEDLSGNSSILTTPDGAARRRDRNLHNARVFPVLVIALLTSVCANIVLCVLLVNAHRSPLAAGASGREESETSSLSLKLTAVQERFSQLCSQYMTLGETCSKPVVRCRPCPEGWLFLEGRCYFFSDDKLDWTRSKESCASTGGHLTILHSHEQHHSLEGVARDRGGFDYHYWIGLSDTETEGVWKWVDNTVVNGTFWNEWHEEPNNHQSGGLHGEDCAVLDSHSKTWFDVPCDFTYKRICEMEAVQM